MKKIIIICLSIYLCIAEVFDAKGWFVLEQYHKNHDLEFFAAF